MKLRGVHAAVVTCCCVLMSCQSPSERYKVEIAGIDSTLLALDSAVNAFGMINSEVVNAAFKQMNTDLRAAQLQLEQSEVSEDDAKLFAEYTRARRLIKDFPQRMRTFPAEIERTQLQLNNLKDALMEGASRDALGNKIDEEYVKKQYTFEVSLAQSLTTELLNTVDYSNRSMDMYEELEPMIRQQFAAWESEE